MRFFLASKRGNWHILWFDSSIVTLYCVSLEPPTGFCQGSSKELSDASSEGSYKPCWLSQLQISWLQLYLRCSDSILQNSVQIMCGIMLSHMDTFLRAWLKSLTWLSRIDFAGKLLRHTWVQQALGSELELLECVLCHLPGHLLHSPLASAVLAVVCVGASGCVPLLRVTSRS